LLKYKATIPSGQPVTPENIRAQITADNLQKLRNQANGDRVTQSEVIEKLETDKDVARAKTILIQPGNSVQVATFITAAEYFDKWGLLGIIQLVTQWQCNASESCPSKVMGELQSLLAKGGSLVKRDVFKEIDNQAWIISSVAYEVPLGTERRVVPLHVRKLEVQQVP